ncbi:alpha/beta hydrolase [Luteimonas huabeiensis]|uniref:alpha/beta hydrolase n=1 Tax=Luteimonas huabeiensis TaxID=1244513 RepID=UPI000467B964|nr:alpha/beta hydrolase [Luteimonas huabeiensis]
MLLAGCTYPIREHNIVIPRTAAPVDLAALRGRFPDHRIEAMTIDAAGGALLHGLRFTREDALATLLYFGGNGYTVARFAERSARAYAEVPVNIVLVDHRGYGASTGTAGLDALLADALTVHDHVRDDARLGGLPLIVHGHSLGSFMAGHVAAARRLDGLVLEGSVTTTEDWATHLRSRQPLWARMLVRRVAPEGALAGKGNLGVVAALDEPVLIVAGADDAVTPPRFAQALFDAASPPGGRKRLLIVSGRDHMSATDSPAFRRALAAFVASDVVAAGRAAN